MAKYVFRRTLSLSIINVAARYLDPYFPILQREKIIKEPTYLLINDYPPLPTLILS